MVLFVAGENRPGKPVALYIVQNPTMSRGPRAWWFSIGTIGEKVMAKVLKAKPVIPTAIAQVEVKPIDKAIALKSAQDSAVAAVGQHVEVSIALGKIGEVLTKALITIYQLTKVEIGRAHV